jgi:rare lipoprotein A
MKVLVVALFSFSLMAHASLGSNQIDDDADDAQGAAGQVLLTDDGTPVALDDSSLLTVQEAALTPAPAGCREINGMASIYGLGQGAGDGAHQKLADGSHLNTGALTAAMMNVPLDSYVTVTRAGHTVRVEVKDRGPYVKGRLIDLTPAAASALGFSAGGAGVAHVTVTVCR